jgi:diguanylate cyclase (GGDEF)-like protein
MHGPRDLDSEPQLGQLQRLVGAGSRDYEGADEENATRLVAVICSLTALLSLLFLPLDEPTVAIGAGGWIIAGALIASGLVGGRALRRRRPPPGFDALLAISYLGLVSVGVLEWLAGGTVSAYSQLTMLWVAAATGVHPLRRSFVFFAVVAVVTAAPLLYDGWSGDLAAELAAQFIFWAALGSLVFVLMSYVRGQRIELREGERQAHELARADELTGLSNRRAFDEALEAELARSLRAASTTSVAMIDLDRFKQINDRYGHLEGDRCLREAARAVERALRAGDRAFRWGGDEFALLLPDTDREGAEQAAMRIAAEVLNTCAATDGTPLAISWGAAEATAGMTGDELLGQADLALMTLKREKLRT